MAQTRDHGAMEQRRRQATRWFEQEISAPEVARQVANRWKQA
jgi:hypothetical protein